MFSCKAAPSFVFKSSERFVCKCIGIHFVCNISVVHMHSLCTFYATTNSFVATTLLVANGAPSSLSSFSSQLRRRSACLKYDLITVGCCELKWSRVDLTGASTSRARSCSETGTCAWNK